jgi:hypothetical protein
VRSASPFRADDLAALHERLFCAATRVVPMRDIHAGDTAADVIGLRHDCDNVLEPAVQMAQWEADHGHTSTYYALHTAPYWRDEKFVRTGLECIAELGHEIGIHNNALAEATSTRGNPATILAAAIERLRGWGFDIKGTVAHGDPRCYTDGKVTFVNDELFAECHRPQYGERTREYAPLMRLQPIPLREFGLEYDANWLPRREYLSDSGGRWSRDFDAFADGFPYEGQSHILIHPDWWEQSFSVAELAA